MDALSLRWARTGCVSTSNTNTNAGTLRDFQTSMACTRSHWNDGSRNPFDAMRVRHSFSSYAQDPAFPFPDDLGTTPKSCADDATSFLNSFFLDHHLACLLCSCWRGKQRVRAGPCLVHLDIDVGVGAVHSVRACLDDVRGLRPVLIRHSMNFFLLVPCANDTHH